MIDYGIGMSAEDILAIADVGTSYERKEKRRERMPSWLLPTAELGIGLQSVFLIANFHGKYHKGRLPCLFRNVWHSGWGWYSNYYK